MNDSDIIKACVGLAILFVLALGILTLLSGCGGSTSPDEPEQIPPAACSATPSQPCTKTAGP